GRVLVLAGSGEGLGRLQEEPADGVVALARGEPRVVLAKARLECGTRPGRRAPHRREALGRLQVAEQGAVAQPERVELVGLLERRARADEVGVAGGGGVWSA